MSPSPRGTWTSASARPRERSCATPARRRLEPHVGSVRASRAHELVAARDCAGERSRHDRGVPRQLGSDSRHLAGREAPDLTKTSAPTSDETGLPGSPKTSVSPRTPKASGFPGLIATPQKTSSTPRSASTRANEIVLAHRHPARRDEDVVLRARARWRRDAPGIVRWRRARHRSRLPRRESGRDHRAVGLVDLTRRELLARVRAAHCPWRGSTTRGRAEHATVATPAAASAPICAGAETRARCDDDVAGAHVAASRPDVLTRESTLAAIRPRDRRDRRRSRPGSPRPRSAGTAAPVEMPAAAPAGRGPGDARAGCDTVRDGKLSGRRRPREAAKPSMAELGKGGRSTCAVRGLAQHAADRGVDRRRSRPPSDATCSRMRSSASSIVRSSATWRRVSVRTVGSWLVGVGGRERCRRRSRCPWSRSSPSGRTSARTHRV